MTPNEERIESLEEVLQEEHAARVYAECRVEEWRAENNKLKGANTRLGEALKDARTICRMLPPYMPEFLLWLGTWLRR